MVLLCKQQAVYSMYFWVFVSVLRLNFLVVAYFIWLLVSNAASNFIYSRNSVR